MTERLTPRERIRKKKDFSVLYEQGRRSREKSFHLVYMPGRTGVSRLGCVTSRKVGNAVTRNRLRRWIRELFRRHKEIFKAPVDLIVIARPDAAGTTFRDFAASFLAAVEKIQRRPAP